ncbi:MAG: SRPBCC domain-containing protein [Melioribacteraceae bacterium]|nr:SRPBCC domain-containing protein [Melioribacteraceae bacterium]
MSDTNEPIIVEQTFNTSINNVWNAITKVDQMRKWFFENIESFKPEVGFATQFSVQSQNRSFLHIWKLTEVVPLKKIIYNWKYGGYSGDSFVMFELFEQQNRTKLRLTHEGIESFPKNIPEFSRESCTVGWNYFIRNSLKKFLEKNTK